MILSHVLKVLTHPMCIPTIQNRERGKKRFYKIILLNRFPLSLILMNNNKIKTLTYKVYEVKSKFGIYKTLLVQDEIILFNRFPLSLIVMNNNII